MAGHSPDQYNGDVEVVMGGHGLLSGLIERFLPQDPNSARRWNEFDVPMTGSELTDLAFETQLDDLLLLPGQLTCPASYVDWKSPDGRSLGKAGLHFGTAVVIPDQPTSVSIMAISDMVDKQAAPNRLMVLSAYYDLGTWSAQQSVGLCGRPNGDVQAFSTVRVERNDIVVECTNRTRPSSLPQTQAFVSRMKDMLIFGVPSTS